MTFLQGLQRDVAPVQLLTKMQGPAFKYTQAQNAGAKRYAAVQCCRFSCLLLTWKFPCMSHSAYRSAVPRKVEAAHGLDMLDKHSLLCLNVQVPYQMQLNKVQTEQERRQQQTKQQKQLPRRSSAS